MYFEDEAKASLRAKFKPDTEIGQKGAFCKGLAIYYFLGNNSFKHDNKLAVLQPGFILQSKESVIKSTNFVDELLWICKICRSIIIVFSIFKGARVNSVFLYPVP